MYPHRRQITFLLTVFPFNVIRRITLICFWSYRALKFSFYLRKSRLRKISIVFANKIACLEKFVSVSRVFCASVENNLFCSPSYFSNKDTHWLIQSPRFCYNFCFFATRNSVRFATSDRNKFNFEIYSEFPRRGAATPEGGANLLFDQFFPENCMKMNKLWPRQGGGRASLVPQDLPLLSPSEFRIVKMRTVQIP